MNPHRTLARAALLALVGAGMSLSSCDIAGSKGGPGPSPGILGSIPQPPAPPFTSPVNTRVTIGNFQQPDGYPYYPSMSSDGRYVAFSSGATNLVPGDTNGTDDIFVRDRDYDGGSATPDGIFDQPDTGTKVVRVSIASDGTQSTSYSFGPMISGNGRFVVFSSYANNLLGTGNDTNNAYDTFVHDRDYDNGSATPNGIFDEPGTGVNTVRVSVSSAGAQATGDSYEGSISADGRFVAFYGYAPNLVPGDTNGTYDVFLRDRDVDANGIYDEPFPNSTTTRVSVEHPSNPDGIADGNNPNGYSFSPSISYDGQFVTFLSYAPDLVPGDTNNNPDVFLWNRLAPSICTRISVGPGGVQANSYSYIQGNSCIAVNGGTVKVVFYSQASNLIAPGLDTNGTFDAFLYDSSAVPAVSRISVDSSEQQANGFSYPTSISAYGDFVAFTSYASNLVPGDINGNSDIFVRDLVNGTTQLVSTDGNGNHISGYSDIGYLSADGSYVAFYSEDSNLIPADLNGIPDIFVKYLDGSETVIRASEQVGGQPSSDCLRPAIAANGTFVAFDSNSLNLVSPATNGDQHVYLRDTASGKTVLISVDSFGNQGTGNSSEASVSADGRFVAFTSTSSNLVPGDSGLYTDVFLRDVVAGVTYRISREGPGDLDGDGGADGDNANGDSHGPSISADGRYVAFTSSAPDLVAGDGNGVDDVFVYDRVLGTTKRVSVITGGGEANDDSFEPSLSSDGKFIAFSSDATNLVGNDTNGVEDIFVHEIATGITTRVSVATNGTEATFRSLEPSISSNGQFVTFKSEDPNIAAGDANDAVPGVNTRWDVFLRDRSGSGTTIRVTSGDNGSHTPRISGNGRYVVFASDATNIVAGDLNGWRDIFVFDRLNPASTPRVSITGSGGEADRNSFLPSITSNGQFIAFESTAGNLVPNDTNLLSDIIMRGPLN